MKSRGDSSANWLRVAQRAGMFGAPQHGAPGLPGAMAAMAAMRGNGGLVGGAPAAMQGRAAPPAASSSRAAVAASAAAAKVAGATPGGLAIAGGRDAIVGPIVRGMYSLCSENHSKPVYKKTGHVGDLDVMVYFWEDRENPEFTGWWFGPKVGGDLVWAYHPDKVMPRPPVSGWQAPFDGPVDPTLVVTPRMGQAGNVAGQAQRASQEQLRKQQLEDLERRRQIDAITAREDAKQSQDPGAQRHAQMLQRAQDERQATLQKAMEQRPMGVLQDSVEAKRNEMSAVLSIRRAVNKVKLSKPETFDECVIELEQVLESEAANCGSQMAAISAEANSALTQAKARVEKMAVDKRKMDEQKAEAAKVKEENEAKAAELMAEFVQLVEAVEKGTEDLNAMAERIAEGEVGVDVNAVADAAEKAHKDCRTFHQTNRAAMELGEGGLPKVRKEISQLLARADVAGRKRQPAADAAEGAREVAVTRAAAKTSLEGDLTTCKKYDLDNDDALNRNEIAAYAKGEFGFALSRETLDHMFRYLVEPDGDNIPVTRFHDIRVAIGVARETQRDAGRREAKEVSRRQLDARIEALRSDTSVVATALEAAAEKVGAAMEEAKRLLELRDSDMSAAEMDRLAEAADVSMQTASAELLQAKEDADAISPGGEENDEIVTFLKDQKKSLTSRAASFSAKLSAASGKLIGFQRRATARLQTELDAFQLRAVDALQAKMQAADQNGEAFFANIDGHEDGTVGKEEFLAVLREAWVEEEFPNDQAAQWFDRFVGAGVEGLALNDFTRLVRVCYKVVKTTVLTNGMNLKDSKVVRRLEVDEVVELRDGPRKDEISDLLRIEARAVKDGATGFVTLTGNQGSTYLEKGGTLFVVVKETLLTKNADLASQDSSRKLKEGDNLDVLEFGMKNKATGLTRLKVRIQSDGAVGWATSVGNTGVAFLKVK